MSKDENPLITELDELNILVTSENWRQYLKLLKKHSEYLQKEVNRFVREQNLICAYGALAKFDDAVKTIEIVYNRLQELRGEK